MSGHSKWSKIKRKKGARDAKRGKLFSKLSRTISVAAREGGGDPEMNFTLRMAIDKAKEANMPNDNIERAIARGTGDDEDGRLEKAVYGGYGPGGVAIAIDALTDNTNRTVSELRKIFEDHNGSLGESSSVLWQFDQVGHLYVECAEIEEAEKYGEDDKKIPVDKDELMMQLMDVEGVKDIAIAEDESKDGFKLCEVVTDVKELAHVRDRCQKKGFLVDSAELARVPQNMQEVDDNAAKKLENLLDELDDHDDVENLWFNVEL